MRQKKGSGQLNLLIDLLDDPDVEVFSQVSQEIRKVGHPALSSLEAAWWTTVDNLSRHRIENLIQGIQFESLYADLESWVRSGAGSLLQGYLIACRLRYPNLDENRLHQLLDRITRSVWIELNEELTAMERVKVINHLLFGINGFGGEVTDIHVPDHYFLNNVLQNRHGNSDSIGMLYAIVAEKLQIPIKCVNLPGNFIVCYVHAPDEFLSGYTPTNPAKFYINPLAGGTVFTQREIDHYLSQTGIERTDACFLPAGNTAILKRWFSDLQDALTQRGDIVHTAGIRKLLELLS